MTQDGARKHAVIGRLRNFENWKRAMIASGVKTHSSLGRVICGDVDYIHIRFSDQARGVEWSAVTTLSGEMDDELHEARRIVTEAIDRYKPRKDPK